MKIRVEYKSKTKINKISKKRKMNKIVKNNKKKETKKITEQKASKCKKKTALPNPLEAKESKQSESIY